MSQILQCTVVDDPGRSVVHVVGEIDLSSSDLLRSAVAPHLSTGGQLVLDLSGVTFMDSTSLLVLLQTDATLRAGGGELRLRAPSDVASYLLAAVGLADAFAIEEPDRA